MRKNTSKRILVFVLSVSLIVFLYCHFFTFQEFLSDEEKQETQEPQESQETQETQEPQEKLQSIVQETNNVTSRIDNAIRNSSLESKDMTNNNIRDIEETTKNIMLEQQKLPEDYKERIEKLQESIKKRPEIREARERGVHIEIV